MSIWAAGQLVPPPAFVEAEAYNDPVEGFVFQVVDDLKALVSPYTFMVLATQLELAAFVSHRNRSAEKMWVLTKALTPEKLSSERTLLESFVSRPILSSVSVEYELPALLPSLT